MRFELQTFKGTAPAIDGTRLAAGMEEPKLRYDLIPPEILRDVAEILTLGKWKYPDENWKTYSLEKNMQSLLRHLEAYRLGFTIDEESGKHNLAHLITRAIFQLYLDKYNNNDKELCRKK